jgi:hypothetical protein
MGGCVASCEGEGRFWHTYTTTTNGTTKTYTLAWDKDSTVKNTGKLVHSGSTNGTVMIGGIFGYLASSNTTNIETALPTNAIYINDGEIEVTGTYYTTALGWNSIGGIIGNTNRDAADKQLILKNATTTDKCKITAWGFPRIGMLIGNTRTANRYAQDCSVAGTIDKGEDGDYKDKETGKMETGWHESPITLKTDNFFKYIYNKEVTEDVAKGDGCSFYVAPTPTPAQ